MNDAFQTRVRSAAIAGWWTVLIGAIAMTVMYFAWLGMMCVQPEFIRWLWGGQIAWTEIGRIAIWFFGAFKLILFAVALASLWLTLWSRRLRRM